MEVKDIISSGILELYALGMASEEEARQVEEWLKLYPEVERELYEIQDGLESYASAHAIPPPPELKKKIMNEISAEPDSFEATESPVRELPLNGKQKAVAYTINIYFKWAAAACFVLLIGSLVLTYTYYNKYKTASTELAVTKDEMTRQKEMASNMDKQISMMTDRNALPISLSGTDVAPEASAKIFWMKNTGDVYVAPSALPDAPQGMQYQLWAIIDGKPVDGGMISKDNNGSAYHIQKMRSFGKAEAFAITLEKEGSKNSTPKGQMYVMAKI